MAFICKIKESEGYICLKKWLIQIREPKFQILLNWMQNVVVHFSPHTTGSLVLISKWQGGYVHETQGDKLKFISSTILLEYTKQNSPKISNVPQKLPH